VAWAGHRLLLLKRGRTETEALKEVDKILAWARVAEGTDTHARQARSLGFSDFEDALQAVSATACAADWIVTRNERDFALSAVPVLAPAEFLQQFPVPK
jgi:predicted nucleic acid-binding protein